MDINSIFKPESVAVVGVSDRRRSFGRVSAENALKSIGITTYFVNPKREELFGKKCYNSLSDLPTVVDSAVICTPKSTVLGIVKEAAELGVKSAVIFASGFNEVKHGKKLEEKIIEIANKNGMSIIGPNCIGIQNHKDQIAQWTMGPPRYFGERPLGVASVAHSGSLTGGLLMNKTTPASYAASVGNANQLTFEDFVEYFADNKNVKIIAGYLEGIKNAQTFANALKIATEKDKPVIILKSGRSKESARCARYHTGDRTQYGAGNIEEYDAVFKKFNVVRVNGIVEYNNTVQMFATLDGNYPSVTGLTGLAGSGGQNTVTADLVKQYGLELPEFDKGTLNEMQKLLPDIATANNPVDTTTELRTDKKDLLKHMINHPDVGILYLLQRPPKKLKDEKGKDNLKFFKDLLDIMPDDKILALTPTGISKTSNEVKEALHELGIIVLPGSQLNFIILRHLKEYLEGKKINRTHKLSIPERTGNEKTTECSRDEGEKYLIDMGVNFSSNDSVRSGFNIKIGIKEYSQFGHMIYVEQALYTKNDEIYDNPDKIIYPAPLNREEAEELIAENNLLDIITDLKAVKNMLVKISDYVYENKDIITDFNIIFEIGDEDKELRAVDWSFNKLTK